MRLNLSPTVEDKFIPYNSKDFSLSMKTVKNHKFIILFTLLLVKVEKEYFCEFNCLEGILSG